MNQDRPDPPPLEDWWAPVQRDCVLNRARQWTRVVLAPADMILFRSARGSWGRQCQPGEKPPDGAEVIRGGWDHEHCSLCWATLHRKAEGGSVGYTDGWEWICEPCFTKHIAPRLG